ncbi:MAG: hypothetical protein STSR0008_23800 [Ignavibacterium sp.]
MKNLIITFLLISSFNFYAQNKSLQEIKDDSKYIFQIKVIEFNAQKYPVLLIDTLDASHYLYSFVQQNKLILDYLLQNQLTTNSDSLMKFVENDNKLKKYFSDTIEKDTAFIKTVTTLISNYLLEQKISISNYTNSDKYEVSIDRIASIAARFFYPDKLVDNGKAISMKLCVGALSFKDYEGNRNFLEEAFAFSVVMNSAQSKEQELVEEYKTIAKDALHMNMSNNNDIKLSRLQGAIWALLAKNEKLLNQIKNNYNKHKNILPFTLVL